MPRWKHSASGYQNHRCRCKVCREAWSAKQKTLYAERKTREPQAAPLTSWWTEAKPEAFTALAERDQLPRMRVGRFGSGIAKANTEYEIHR